MINPKIPNLERNEIIPFLRKYLHDLKKDFMSNEQQDRKVLSNQLTPEQEEELFDQWSKSDLVKSAMTFKNQVFDFARLYASAVSQAKGDAPSQGTFVKQPLEGAERGNEPIKYFFHRMIYGDVYLIPEGRRADFEIAKSKTDTQWDDFLGTNFIRRDFEEYKVDVEKGTVCFNAAQFQEKWVKADEALNEVFRLCKDDSRTQIDCLIEIEETVTEYIVSQQSPPKSEGK